MHIFQCAYVFVDKVIRVSQAHQVFREEVCLVSPECQVRQVLREQRSDQEKKINIFYVLCKNEKKKLLRNYKWNLKLYHDSKG